MKPIPPAEKSNQKAPMLEINRGVRVELYFQSPDLGSTVSRRDPCQVFKNGRQNSANEDLDCTLGVRGYFDTTLSDGVMVAQGSLEAFVMVQIHVGQPLCGNKGVVLFSQRLKHF